MNSLDRSRQFFRISIVTVALLSVTGCRSLTTNDIPDRSNPSNDRIWSPEFSQVPTAEFNGGTITVRNVRNNNYLTEQDFVLNYEDRQFDLDHLVGVDFLVCPFQDAQYLAHTMLSFRFEASDAPDASGKSDPQFLAVSAEIRTEQGESYSPFLGITNQFELAYVVADERDLIRLRTRHRNAEVFIYETIAGPEQAKALFLDVMQRINQLSVKPEFYHTLLNNCTTSIVKHVNAVAPNRVPYNYSVLLPGLSAKYAYDLGLLDQSTSFGELKARSNVTALSEKHYDDPSYSLLIRGQR